MASGNSVTLVGNLTRDPDLRFTPSGQAVANVGLAVNRRWQNRQTQEWEEQTSFFDLVIWQDLGSHAAESLTKGCRVVVVGRLDQRSWEDKEGGGNRSKVEIVVDEIAPSLRWATVEVHKVDRQHADGPQSAGGQAPPPPEPDYSDEEPF